MTTTPSVGWWSGRGQSERAGKQVAANGCKVPLDRLHILRARAGALQCGRPMGSQSRQLVCRARGFLPVEGKAKWRRQAVGGGSRSRAQKAEFGGKQPQACAVPCRALFWVNVMSPRAANPRSTPEILQGKGGKERSTRPCRQLVAGDGFRSTKAVLVKIRGTNRPPHVEQGCDATAAPPDCC